MAYSDNVRPPIFGAPDPRLVPPLGGYPEVSHKQTVGGDTSLIDRLFTGQPPPNNGYADLSSILGAFSSGEKADRGMKGSVTGDYDRMMAALEATRNANALNANTQYDNSMLAAQTGRNQSEADAWRKLGQTEYVRGGGSNFKMPTLSYGGQTMTPPSFGLAPARSTEREMEGAKTLQDTIMSRFGEEGSYQPSRFTPEQSFQPHPFEDYGAEPGMLEKLGSYGGAIAGGIGAIDNIAGLGGGGGGILSKAGGAIGKLFGLGGGGGGETTINAAGVPVNMSTAGINPVATGGSKIGNIMGKAAPIAGAALGTYGLLKDRGLGSNIANGAMAGAGYGSFIPGIGTLVGAGIGAGVGALRGVGGPNKEEQAGRTSGAQAVQQIGTGATPAQIQEAQGSGWEHPEDALASIVMRDRLQAAGKDPNSAGMYLNMIKQAEKAGPDAVQSVIQRIMGEFGQQQVPGQFGQPSAQPRNPGLTPGGPGTYRG